MDSTTTTPPLHVLIAEEPPPPGLLEIAEEEPLSVRLLAEGWAPGLPPRVTPETFAIDAKVYGRMACPECGRRRSSAAKPYHRDGAYRLVVTCDCGGETCA